MIFLYRTQEYLSNITEDPGQKTIIEKKLDELQNRHGLDYYSKNPRCYDKAGGIWVLKFQGKGQNSRVILQELKTEPNLGHQLVIIRDYVSQSKYEPKWRAYVEPIIDNGQYLKHFPLSAQEQGAALDFYSKQISRKEEKKRELPAELRDWLISFSIDHKFAVYESMNWPKYQQGIDKYAGDLYPILMSIVKNDNDPGTRVTTDTKRHLYAKPNDTVTIVYESAGENDSRIFLLHGWCSNQKTETLKEIVEEAKSYLSLSSSLYHADEINLMSSGAYRGYPASIFTKPEGREVWSLMQGNSNKSNLALSPEQVSLLKRIHFPLFINGQAGSGKSEMLMYLFAELIFQKEVGEYEGGPIFLTENEELLDRSHLEVIEKLRYNSRYAGYHLTGDDTRKYFSTFHNFLREGFFDQDDDVYHRIRKDSKYIHFYRFKQLYQDFQLSNAIKRKYPAEIAWFVINTFIRGYTLDIEEYTVEDFKQLYRKDKTNFVTEEIYEDIYLRVWHGFYKKLIDEQGYWDRLYIIKEIFRKYKTIPEDKKYTIILCDEAQDYSRLELQFLLQLSRYTQYDLSEIKQAPVTFAGDPFQTVNPTGFNLSQVKRLFSQELERTYGISIAHDYVYSLDSNYRSTPEIVNLANVIQYIRNSFLKHSELDKPQNAKRFQSKLNPKLITISFDNKEQVYERLKYEVFIAPCNYGEEKDFLAQDGFLKPDVVLKSAAKSKGNEYEKVVLYQFGNACVADFGEMFLTQLFDGTVNIDGLDVGLRFRLSFFFNKLYVALTRARQELIILETDRGKEGFWDIICTHKAMRKIDNENWQDIAVENILDFVNVDMIGTADFKTAYKNARSEMEQGELYEDPDKIKDAILWLRKINDDGRHANTIQYCEARRAQFSQQYKTAGDLFRKCTKKDLADSFDPQEEASKCYWIGGYWLELLDLHGDESSALFSIRNLVSRIMLNEKFDFQDIIRYNRRIQSSIKDDKKLAGKIEWENEFYQQLAAIVNKRINELSGRWGELAMALASFEFRPKELDNLIATLFYKSQNFQRAFDIWSDLETVDNSDFWICGVEISQDVNNRIYYLHKLKRWDAILEEYNKNGSLFDEDSYRIVLENYYRNSKAEDVFRIYSEHKSLLPLIIELILKDDSNKRALYIYTSLVEAALESPDSLLDTSSATLLTINGSKLIKKHLAERKELQILSSRLDRDIDESSRKKISRLINKTDGLFEGIAAIIKVASMSNLDSSFNYDGLDNIIVNFITCLDERLVARIDSLELSVCLDKLIAKYTIIQNLYVKHKGILLRREDLSIHARDILEERFWRIRYLIATHGNATELSIQQEIEATFERFRAVPLLERVVDIRWLRDIPAVTTPLLLRKSIEEKQLRFELSKKSIGERIPKVSQETMPESIPKKNTLDELMEEIKKMNRQMEELRQENKALLARNQELIDKLLNK